MSRLERKFLILILAFMTMIASVGFFAFKEVTDHVIDRWGERLVENQVRYNSSRLLQPLGREIALAQQMAGSPTLIQWAENPGDEDLREQAMQELESFRQNYQAKSYFIALTKTLDYYHNDASGTYTGSELRYRLRENRPADAWFFRLVNDGRDLHININPDVELGVTKLWIDVLMRNNEGEILAVLGTGLPLEEVLSDFITNDRRGVTGLFVDVTGAIQLYQDQRLIDFASFVQPEGQKRTIDLLMDLPEDGQMLLETMRDIRANPDSGGQVTTRYATIEGERHLVGLTFLPAIGWFDVTFLDIEEIMPTDRYWLLAALFLGALFLSLVAIFYALRREVINPLETLMDEMDRFGRHDGRPIKLENVHQGELGRVFSRFQAMERLVHANVTQLESMVAQRTKELEEVARRDDLTGLLNRKAMTKALAFEAERAAATETRYGIIWIDIDDFKSVNDRFGHAAGDALLEDLGRVVREELQPYTHVARWGGDEFLVLLSACTDQQLEEVSGRIRQSAAESSVFAQYGVTVSTGAALSRDDESVEDVLARSDADLYRAKDLRHGVRRSG